MTFDIKDITGSEDIYQRLKEKFEDLESKIAINDIRRHLVLDRIQRANDRMSKIEEVLEIIHKEKKGEIK